MELNTFEIGQRIRKARNHFGLTQEKFSELIEISANYLWEIENGKKVMSLPTLVKISSTLRISIDSIIFGVQENTPENQTTRENTVQDNLEQDIWAQLGDKEKQIFTAFIKTLIPHLKTE
ncbi:MAG: helix-turn-helix transcriptional regulator [Hyphomonadaceae bacterium]|nr:helix-turn-helix transcriptional regulator [Clostridia bacterium]